MAVVTQDKALNPNQLLIRVSTAMLIGLLAIVALLIINPGAANSTQQDNVTLGQ